LDSIQFFEKKIDSWKMNRHQRSAAPLFRTVHRDKDDEEDCDTCDNLKAIDALIASSDDAEADDELHNNDERNDDRNAIVEDELGEPQWNMNVRPPGLAQLGNAAWTVLHTMAAYYPDEPKDEQRDDMEYYIMALAHTFPCTYCARDFQEYLECAPPQLENRHAFEQWACIAHNAVNAKLGKPRFDCSRVSQRWRRDLDSLNDDFDN
jgi:mitochondrial FAD-linked sulfhydryl oxidase